LNLYVTAPGYADYSAIVTCNTTAYAPITVTLTPTKSLVTFRWLGQQNANQAAIGCGTVSWPGGSCTTDQSGQCKGYVDLTKANTVTASCPPMIATTTTTLGPMAPTPCTLFYSFPGNCAAGFVAAGGVYDPHLATGAGGGLYCLSQDGLTATVAGQSIKLAWNPAHGVWAGCGTLPAVQTIDWTKCLECGGCGGGFANYITRDLPFSVTFDTTTSLQIVAPLCVKVGNGQIGPSTVNQSYAYDGTVPPGTGIYASCDPAQWPMLQWFGAGGGPSLYGELSYTGCALYVDTAGWQDQGNDSCIPYAGHGVIPAALAGQPPYLLSPFGGPVTVVDALGRRGPGAPGIPGRDGGGPSGGPAGGGAPRAGPSLARRAVNFAGAAAAHISHGRPETPPAEVKRRLASCESCLGPLGYWNPLRRSCAHPQCGCNMDLKVTWADMSCPIGRWPAVAPRK
jgi:hypothetical protein